MRRNFNILKSLDWFAIAMYLLLVVCGWFAIYAATYDFETSELFSISGRPASQLVWIGCAFVLAIALLAIDSKFYSNIAYIFYALMIVLLIVTIFISPDIKGSHSWIRIGSFSIQPAEFAKYATALCLARMMSVSTFDIRRPGDFAKVMGVIFLPVLIIIAQSETGSALVFLSLLLMLYREGMNGLILVLGVLAAAFFIIVLRFNAPMPEDTAEVAAVLQNYGYVAAFSLASVVAGFFIRNYTHDDRLLKIYAALIAALWIAGFMTWYFLDRSFDLAYVALTALAAGFLLLLAWGVYKFRMAYMLIALFLAMSAGLCFSVDYAFDNILEPHQQIRIKVVLGLEDDPMGAGYNVRQSKIAIGSGGFTGKGFLNGTQTKLNYVPEQDTDFIFCTIGEERGFLGTSAFVILYLVFLLRLIYLAERQRSSFSRIYGYCVACIFFFHFAINIGMVIGLLPVIGIPLPFISYGGSSMWSFTLLLFTFLRLDANRMEVLQND